MANLQEFIAQWNGRANNFDGAYGPQCVDIVNEYNKTVVGAPGRLAGNGKDIINDNPGGKYTRVANTPNNAPSPGDIIVWSGGLPGSGGFGHVAIVVSANAHSFTSFDQNWSGVGYCRIVSHNYNYVLGWLHPNLAPSTPPVPAGGVVTVMRDVTVITTALNVRTGPGTNFPTAVNPSIPNGTLARNAVISITGWEHAQNVGGSDVWLRTVRNNWVWSGGTNW